MHAEIKIGDSIIMMGESRGKWKPSPGFIYLYVSDMDAVYKHSLLAGTTSIMELADPSRNVW